MRADLGIPAGAPVVGAVAVFRAQKRLADWIGVARRVGAERPDAVFLLAGDGPDMPMVRREAAASGLGGRLLLPGFRADGRAVLGAVDVFLMTSAHEGMPIALLEAMALGKPVVATAVGGTPEVVTDGRQVPAQGGRDRCARRGGAATARGRTAAPGRGDLQGNILPVRSLIEPVQVIVDNGAKKVLVPGRYKRQFLEVPGDLLERVDPIFYSEPLAAALKAIGMG